MAAYIYQACTCYRIDTIKDLTPRQILKRVIEIVGVGLPNQKADLAVVLSDLKQLNKDGEA